MKSYRRRRSGGGKDGQVHIVVAPDGFKGTLSARQAARAIAEGWASARPDDCLEVIPMSDGGPGFLDALSAPLSGRILEVEVRDPLGRAVTARLLASGDACYVESAEACGLDLVPPLERNPFRSSSAGVADLIRAAAATKARRVVVGLGGSATNDGGAGMLGSLGLALLDAEGRPLEPGARFLELADRVEQTGRRQLPEIVAATDVDNPLLGPAGASAVFGPQKGASPSDVARLEALLERLVRVVGRDVDGAAGLEREQGAGAAGGLGYGLFVLGARRCSGAQLVIGATRLGERVARADLVITGEGSFDAQSLGGKLVSRVAAAARAANVPCLVLAGRVEVAEADARAAGIVSARSLAEAAGSPEAAIERPRAHLVRLAAREAGVVRDLRL